MWTHITGLCSMRRCASGLGVLMSAFALLAVSAAGVDARTRLSEGAPDWRGVSVDVEALTEAGWGIPLEAAGLKPPDPVVKVTPVTLTSNDQEALVGLASAVFDAVFGADCGAPVRAYRAENTDWANRGLRGGGCRVKWDVSVAQPEAGLMLLGTVVVQPGGLWGAFRLTERMSVQEPASHLTLALLNLPNRALSIGMVQSLALAGGHEWSLWNWPHDRTLSSAGHRPWCLGVRAWSDGQVYLLMAGVLRASPNVSTIPLLASQFGVDPIESCLPRFEGFPETLRADLAVPDLSDEASPEASFASVLDGVPGRSLVSKKAKAFRLFGSREWSQARPEEPPLAVRKLLGLPDGFTCPTLHVRGDAVLGDATVGLLQMDSPEQPPAWGRPNYLAEARSLVQWVSGDGYVALTTVHPDRAPSARDPAGAGSGRVFPPEFARSYASEALEGLLGALGQGLCWLPWTVGELEPQRCYRLTMDPETQLGYPQRTRLGDTVWGGVQVWVDGSVVHAIVPTER